MFASPVQAAVTSDNRDSTIKMSTHVAVTTPISPNTARAERARASILAAAEDLFATKGFDATRITDVADAVKMTRAGLFYYFPDKESLFDAVLKEAFGPLAERLEQVLAKQGISIPERIEQGLLAWVDTILTRPAIARLILRLVADGTKPITHGLLSDNNKIVMQFWALFEQGRQAGAIKPMHDNPFHVSAASIGMTVFYAVALDSLVPKGEFQPLSTQEAMAHKEEVLRAWRLLLGIKDSSSDPP